jgi:enhancing lycopene biosynthesis protein 2
MTKVAVVLSGCGFLDGSEIHESVLTLLSLAQNGIEYQCFAPNIPQFSVINHLSKEESNESPRNVLNESARIARCDISTLSKLEVSDYDALIIPGGRGVSLNLSTYAVEQTRCSINVDLRKVLLEFHESKKPIGAMCISPAILARIFEKRTPLTMTMGTNPEMLSNLKKMSMRPKTATMKDVVCDRENLIFTTPAYLESGTIADLFEGISKMVSEITNALKHTEQTAELCVH